MSAIQRSAVQRSAVQRSAVRLPRRVHGLLGEVGELFVIALEAVRRTWDVRTWAWEFAEQAWFLARVTSIPVILVSLPLGATVALQVGQLAAQLGAQSATGGAVVVGLVREVAPIAAALIIAGAGGSAMTADMGARRIRDELSAMEAMAVNPVHRLVTPRLWAASLVSTLLASLVIVAGAAGGFVFNVLLQDVTPGAYFDGAVSLLQTSDLVVTLLKSWLFGVIAAVVACYMGMSCAASPVGVGRAVNRAIVVAFMLVFALNYVITTVYFVAFPPRI
ncbi:MlaE family ABC transporter permease [Actinomadura geliboluensis]|uniref:MlaE family ABC transporter permease n=1 Tax=Actinomadura geliboluensis TaxID=882440 RepID=UPI00368D7C88